MPKVTLPEGCTGLDFDNGSSVSGPQGSAVEVTDAQAREIDGSWYKRSNVMNSSQRLSIGTKGGKYCTPCRRLWNAWNETCPKCGEPTENER